VHRNDVKKRTSLAVSEDWISEVPYQRYTFDGIEKNECSHTAGKSFWQIFGSVRCSKQGSEGQVQKGVLIEIWTHA
jgi:hypothetical protein